MPQFEIRPQEIYLLERYSSAEYFKAMLDAYANMVSAAEKALDIFMQDLPYNYRDQHISQQPDVVWGEHVLPKFRSTLEGLHTTYKRLLEGEKEAIEYAANVKNDLNAQSTDYWPDWMDQVNQDDFVYWQGQARKISRNIFITVFNGWKFKSLAERYNVDARGVINLPQSLPVYKINSVIKIKTDELVPQDGIYTPAIQNASAQFLLKGTEAMEALVGLTSDGLQYDHLASTDWFLVERIADTGGSAETIETENLKGFGGEICPRSGCWWSPANQSQSCYFEQGEIFPEIANSAWGKTIWYLEVTNKN